MRVAVISDIHGNQIALEAVLEDLSHQSGIDHLVIAGDLCLNGPCPQQVLATVQKLGCPVIQGNVDATRKITVRKGGRLIGDLRTPGIVIEDGAYFKGNIEIVTREPRRSDEDATTAAARTTTANA